MFATHRGIYNMAVAWSWKDCLPIFVPRKRKDSTARGRKRPKKEQPIVRTKFKSIVELTERYRAISRAVDMHKYFRNKHALARHLRVPAEVRDNAFRDFLKAVESSRALFFSLKAKGKPATFPYLTFKSRYARSDTIELRPASVRFVVTEPKQPPPPKPSARKCSTRLYECSRHSLDSGRRVQRRRASRWRNLHPRWCRHRSRHLSACSASERAITT